MSYHYIPSPVIKTTCIGNSLSTLNISLTSLDTELYTLSSYTIDAVTNLNTKLVELSSYTESSVDLLNTAIDTVSSELINNTFRQYIVVQDINGTINWDASVMTNFKVILERDGRLENPTNISSGQTGNVVVQIGSTSSVSLTSFGDSWLFVNGVSGVNGNAYAFNLINYYYDDNSSKLLANLTSGI